MVSSDLSPNDEISIPKPLPYVKGIIAKILVMKQQNPELESYFKEFDKLGESEVRMAVYTHQWDERKNAAAIIWLSNQEESETSKAIQLNRHIAIAAYIAAFAAIIGAAPTIWNVISFLFID